MYKTKREQHFERLKPFFNYREKQQGTKKNGN